MASRPRILYLTHRFPYPPNRGDRIRAYHSLRVLSKYADIYLGTTADEDWAPEHLRALTEICKEVAPFRIGSGQKWTQVISGILQGRSATEGAFYSSGLAAKVREWTATPLDAAILFCSSMGQYCRSFQTRPNKLVVDFVDVDSQKWDDYAAVAKFPKQWLYRREAKKIGGLEEQQTKLADAVTVVSADEAELFHRRHPELTAHAISNGVDSDYFRPDAIPEAVWRPLQFGSPHMVFVGVLDYLPNIQGLQWFCQTVFPRLRDLYPNARLDIVGRRPTAEVNALNQIPGVHVIGEVADVRPYVLASHFAIAPLLIARGIQNKVLEALACGRPVVATPDAATGIDSLRGIFVASPVPEEWLKQIERLQDPGVSAQASAWARNDTVDHYGWEAKLGPLLDLVGINGDPSRSMNRGSR